MAQQYTKNSIHEVLRRARAKLTETSPTPHLDAEVLVAHILCKPRSYLHTWPEKEQESDQLNAIENLIENRYAGHPIAYLIGQKQFWSLDLDINPSVLIPRPETELLVKLALNHIPKDQDWRIADLGTGSGAIAVALAHERPNLRIDACDNCRLGLALAENNAKKHSAVNISFYLSDWFSNVPSQKYHLILSNPPYIAENDPHLHQGDVRFEPVNALKSGQDGLDALKTISKDATHHLKTNGYLIFEHGYTQAGAVADIFAKQGFSNISAYRDLSGHLRATVAQWLPTDDQNLFFGINPHTPMIYEEIEIPFSLMNLLAHHAHASPQMEICGLIGSQNGIPTTCYPIENKSPIPHSRFQMDAQQQIGAMRTMRESHQDWFAIYHSHPHSEAFPSERDLDKAAYYEILYIIISLDTQGDPDIRGFRINKSKEVREVRLLAHNSERIS